MSGRLIPSRGDIDWGKRQVIMRLWSALLTTAMLIVWVPSAIAQTNHLNKNSPAGFSWDLGDDESFGLIPVVLTTRVTSRPVTEVARGSSETSWLQGLDMPDFQMSLTDPVVAQLERIREPGRWHNITERWLKQSGRYEAMIRKTLREEGVPEDLLYVAMIESSFNAKARSHAGAAGLWQFMPAAGAENQLRQDRWVDQRYDPERSTRAAAKALKRLHKRLGTWELAFAAYNMGYYGLQKSIRTYNTNDYWRLWNYEYALPYETRNYVPRILAAAVVGRNLERFGLRDVQRDPPVQYEVVEVPRSMTLSRLAKLSKTSRQQLERLNPELRKGRTPVGAKAYSLRVPVGGAELATAKLMKMRKAPPVKLARHRVKQGEGLGEIAEQYGISKAKLARLNEMTPREKVEPGSLLLVPAGGKAGATSEANGETVDVVVPPRQFIYRDRRRVFYHTVAGDTVEAIATSFGVTAAEIVQWNDLSSNATLHTGMVLQVFVHVGFDQWSKVRVLREEQVRIYIAGTTELYEHVAVGQDRRRIVVRAKTRDTVKRLSKRYGVSEGLIARINHFSRRHEPEVGEEIVLYVDARRVPRKSRRVKGAKGVKGRKGVKSANGGN